MSATSPENPDAPSSDWLSETALRDLYEREAGPLTRAARRRVGSSEEAEDVVQDAFVKLASVRDASRINSPASYLRRVVRNLILDQWRRNSRAPIVEQGSAEYVRAPAADDQEAHVVAAQTINVYRRAVDALPPRTRHVFLLHRKSGRSYKDIASELGISVRTVEWHIAQALIHIRRAIDDA